MLYTTVTPAEKRERFRELLAAPEIARFPGAFTPLSTKLIQEQGLCPPAAPRQDHQWQSAPTAGSGTWLRVLETWQASSGHCWPPHILGAPWARPFHTKGHYSPIHTGHCNTNQGLVNVPVNNQTGSH